MNDVSISLRNKMVSYIQSAFVVVDHNAYGVRDFGNPIEKYDRITLIQKSGEMVKVGCFLRKTHQKSIDLIGKHGFDTGHFSGQFFIRLSQDHIVSSWESNFLYSADYRWKEKMDNLRNNHTNSKWAAFTQGKRNGIWSVI